MKKLVKVVAIVMIALAFSCSSNDEGSGTSGDAIVGTWKLVSSTENGVAVPAEECDDLESSEFKSNGDFIGKDYDLENGNCVLQEVNEPGVTVTTKWEKIADNSYKVKFIINGQESPFNLAFTTVFSNNNNTVTTTATEEDGDLVVSILEKI